jgi:drug/metabolite transporter (DMT)-like permease
MVWFLVKSDKPILIYLKTISFESIVAATTLGVLCTGVAIIIFFKLIQRKSAVFASQSNYLIPCFGFLWSFIFLEEKLTINLLIGLIMIVFGGYLINYKRN